MGIGVGRTRLKALVAEIGGDVGVGVHRATHIALGGEVVLYLRIAVAGQGAKAREVWRVTEVGVATGKGRIALLTEQGLDIAIAVAGAFTEAFAVDERFRRLGGQETLGGIAAEGVRIARLIRGRRGNGVLGAQREGAARHPQARQHLGPPVDGDAEVEVGAFDSGERDGLGGP